MAKIYSEVASNVSSVIQRRVAVLLWVWGWFRKKRNRGQVKNSKCQQEELAFLAEKQEKRRQHPSCSRII
jgi:hypothetical protein